MSGKAWSCGVALAASLAVLPTGSAGAANWLELNFGLSGPRFEKGEEFVYRGQPDFRLPGLLTHEGRQQLDGGDWAAVERALGDVLAAVTQLDDAGYRGPYALALAPPLYNGLFRLYPGTDVS